MTGWTIRTVRAGDGPRLRALRLRALADSPQAFCETYAAAATLGVASWEKRIERSSRPRRQVMYVAETPGGSWLGMMGAFTHDELDPDDNPLPDPPVPAGEPYAMLHGVFVVPEARRHFGTDVVPEALRRSGTDVAPEARLSRTGMVPEGQRLSRTDVVPETRRPSRTDVVPEARRPHPADAVPQTRHAGLAVQLLSAVRNWVANELGISWLGLEVHEDNRRAIRFYERNGFRRTSLRHPYPLDPTTDELVMVARLT